MPLRVWDGTAWKEVGTVKVWNGSSWVGVTNAHAWDGTAWKKFFPSVYLTAQTAFNYSKSGIGGSATATYRLTSTGVARKSNTSGTLVDISGQWLVGGTASDYEARGTWSGSGGTIAGPTTWTSLSSTQDWTLTVSNNNVIRDLALEIRIASSGLVVASATITFDVDSAP